MIHQNTGKLRELLGHAKRHDLVAEDSFDIPDDEFNTLLAEAKKQHPEEDEETVTTRAQHRFLTLHRISQSRSVKFRGNLDAVVGHQQELLALQIQDLKNRQKDASAELQHRNSVESGLVGIKSGVDQLLSTSESQNNGITTKLNVVSASQTVSSMKLNQIETRLSDLELSLSGMAKSAVEMHSHSVKFTRVLLRAIVIVGIILLVVTLAHSQVPANSRPAVASAAAPTLAAGYNPLSEDLSGNLRVGITSTVTINTSGLATSANQTSGGQKTQVVDASGNVQPSGDIVGRAIFEKVTDGTNTSAVKAASTAAAATDPALVVTLSPNSATPQGSGGSLVVSQSTSGSLLAIVYNDHCAKAAQRNGTTSFTTATSGSVVTAAGVGIKTYVYSVQTVNTGATNAMVTLLDGSGGSVLGRTVAPSTYGGSNVVFESPLVTTANTALFAQTDAASTTVYVSVQTCAGP